MSAPRAEASTNIVGRLVKDPTDLTAAFPYGGTALGLVRDAEWIVGTRNFKVVSEVLGSPVEAVYARQSVVLSCVAREFDSDFLSSTFLSTAAGGTTGRRIVQSRPRDAAKDMPGRSLEDLAAKIYFAPLDEKAHGLILYRALPLIDEAAPVNLQLRSEVGILCLWQATPDDTDRVYDVGPREDISV